MAGEILGQVEVAVLPGDTPKRSPKRVLIAEHQLYPRMLGEFVSARTRSRLDRASVGALALALPETRCKTSHGSPGWSRQPSERQVLRDMSNRHHGEEAIGAAGQMQRAGRDGAADRGRA